MRSLSYHLDVGRLIPYAAGGLTWQTIVADLPWTAGTLTHDAAQWPRTTCQVTIADTTLTPSKADSALLPFGNWLRVRVDYHDEDGITLDNWTAATLVIDNVQRSRPDQTLVVTAVDPSMTIADHKLSRTRGPYKSGTTILPITEQITRLARRTLGDNWTVSDRAATVQKPDAEATWDGDPWGVIEGLATDAGLECWFDRLGGLVIDEPRKVSEGSVAATLDRTRIERVTSDIQRAPNMVVIRYKSAKTRKTVLGRWFDVNSVAGVGHYLYPWIEDRQGSPTVDQANHAAARLARRVCGRTTTLTLDAPVAPNITPRDVLEITLQSTPYKHRITRISHPFDGTAASITCRSTAYMEANQP